MTIGVLYVDVIGAFLNWRWISVACLGLVFVWSLLLLYIPESPGTPNLSIFSNNMIINVAVYYNYIKINVAVYYIAQRDFDGAKGSLVALRGHSNIHSELADLQVMQIIFLLKKHRKLINYIFIRKVQIRMLVVKSLFEILQSLNI